MHLKDHTPRSSGIYSRSARLVQHSQINKYDSPHKKMKVRYHMIILIDAEKAFDKIQHPFMIKTLSKIGLEETYLNITKAIYDKFMTSSYSMDKKVPVFPLRSGITGISTFTSLIHHRAGSPSHINQKRRNQRSKL